MEKGKLVGVGTGDGMLCGQYLNEYFFSLNFSTALSVPALGSKRQPELPVHPRRPGVLQKDSEEVR